MEDKEYNYKEVVQEPGLQKETVERRRGRDIIIAIDHGPNSKHAFDWTLVHLARIADTIHLLLAVSSKQISISRTVKSYQLFLCYFLKFFCFFWNVDVGDKIVYETSQRLLEKLAVEAYEVAMVSVFLFF